MKFENASPENYGKKDFNKGHKMVRESTFNFIFILIWNNHSTYSVGHNASPLN